MKMSLFQSKRFVLTLTLTMCCVAFSVFILGLAIAFNKAPNNKSTSVQYIYGNNSIVKLEVIDDITLEDDTIEKLQPKIQVTATGEEGQFGELVLVTQTHVMFDYILAGETHSFATMGKGITINAGSSMVGRASPKTIPDKDTLKTFRDDVNRGINYSGTTVKLTADINLNGQEWEPIGTTANSFKGIFDGQGHTISNFKMGPGIYTGHVGLFGYTEGATIKNLNIESATIDFTDSNNEYYKEFKISTIKGYRGIRDFDDCDATPVTIGLYIGVIVGEMVDGTISECRVGSTCSITVKAVSITNGSFDSNSQNDNKQFSQMIGGIVGIAYGTIENCESNVSITAYNKNQREFCVSGICGGWHYFTNSKGLTVNNCMFKGGVKIFDESVGTTNPTYLSYGGIVGGSYRFEYFFTSNKISSVKINNCVAILDNFELKGCDKSTAKTQFDNCLEDNMTRCRFSFQPIFGLIPVYRKGAGNSFHGYTDKQIIDFNGKTSSLFSGKNNHYTKSSNFFTNCLDSVDYDTITAKFVEGVKYGSELNI